MYLSGIFLVWLAFRAAALSNPIISGFNPDPSILRVGDEYYIATSSFEYFPGTPIYKSKDLQNWELISHAFQNPAVLQLYGTPTGAGGWAPSLSYTNGRFYLAAMTRWTYDPVARVWPRVYFTSSTDLLTWSNLTWCEPWGIDPELFHDPQTNRTYLNLMAPNNNKDRLWGIYQCEVSLKTGNCIQEYRSLWNGTLPHNGTARPEGPKMLFKDGFYYLLIAEGGTDQLHRSSIARSRSPSGPFDPAPNNPLIYNGAYGFDNLTVQSTGHATLVETPNGEWYAAFLARRNVNGSSPLGRETFLTDVKWDSDGWPVFNNGQPILLGNNPAAAGATDDVIARQKYNFTSKSLDKGWYQLRTPYTVNFQMKELGLVLKPNVFGLSDRDTPAALFRKQTSLNMTFSAALISANISLGPRMNIGISAYLSEFQHQDIGVGGCINGTGMCIYTQLWMNQTSKFNQIPLAYDHIPEDLVFHIRASPLKYELGYSIGRGGPVQYLAEIGSYWQAFAPPNFFVFEGNTFALFASGNGEPWPHDAPDVGFKLVEETYFVEDIPDYDVW